MLVVERFQHRGLGDKSSDLRSEFRFSSLPLPCPDLPEGMQLAFGSLLVWVSKYVMI